MQFTHSFTGILDKLPDSTYLIIYLPAEITDSLPSGRFRTKGLMNGVPFDLAIQCLRTDAPRYFIGKKLAAQLGIGPGGKIKVEFNVTDYTIVEIPEELQEVLDQDEYAAAIFNEMNPGMRRSLCIYVTSVKNVDSRIHRALELCDKMKKGELYSQRNKQG